MSNPTYRISDVKPVIFEAAHASENGEFVVFTVKDKKGTIGHIAINWVDIGVTCHLIARGADKAKERRRELGKDDTFKGETISPQLVQTFQVSELPDQHLKVLSLQSPTGLRCDFAIPTNTTDQRGRSFPRAIADELIGDTTLGKQRPH